MKECSSMRSDLATSSKRYFIDLETEIGAFNYNPLDVVITKGRGVWLWEVDGNKYLDRLSTYSAGNQGHRHSEILRAMVDHARRLTFTPRTLHNDQLGLFYKELCDLNQAAREPRVRN